MKSAQAQATEAAQATLFTFASEVSASRPAAASPMLSLLLHADISILISAVEGTTFHSSLHQGEGLSDTIAALADTGILGSSFSAHLLHVQYSPRSSQCRSVGSFVPHDCEDCESVRYSRITELVLTKGTWLISRDSFVMFP